MKWNKMGQIFNVDEYGIDFAKSPQALVLDKFIRIYFSTCVPDGDKVISRILYVDFTKNFDKIINLSPDYVISNGNLGCFDEHGIFPFCPLRFNNKIYAYTGGWTRRISVSADSSIGLAISNDEGLTFDRIGDGPILSTSLYEPYLVNDGFVRVFNDIFHMWYIYGTKWINAAEYDNEHSRVYKIGHATSKDGMNWDKEGRQIIEDKLNINECQALPTVIKIQNRYHMFFCYREATDFRTNKNRSYRMGYAYSTDLVKWIRDDAEVGIEVSHKGWDSEMICYPNVFQNGDKIYMLYNGNNFGKYGFGLAVLEDY